MQLLRREMIHSEALDKSLSNLQRKSLGNTNERSLVVVLADSDNSVCSSIVEQLRLDHHLAVSCGSCNEVERALSQQMPDLLLLGNLTEISYLEAFRKYSSQYQDLPIILLTAEPTINQFFRDWAISKGVYDVLSSCPRNLSILSERLQRMMHPELEATSKPSASVPLPPIVQKPVPESLAKIAKVTTSIPASLPSQPVQSLNYYQVVSVLTQITEFSKKYFGELVLGNYWKKAQNSAVSEHPWLSYWSIEYNGKISYFSEDLPDEQLTDEQYQSLKLWVSIFLKECDRIIGDYTELIQQKGLSVQVNQIISAF
jgi:CheY-like chemotaxis protein